MNKLRLLALLAVAALVLFPAVSVFAAAPSELMPPCRFYGPVQVDGADVPDTTIISVTIGNETKTVATVDSNFSIVIAGASHEGQSVTFKIDDVAVTLAQPVLWTSGDSKKVPLSIGEAVSPGGACTCTISNVVLGNSTYFDSATKTLYIKKADITGPAGTAGPTGAKGAQGDPGKDASNVMGIVAIVIAAIALLVAVVVMLRKKPA